jgi:hypothetical protein
MKVSDKLSNRDYEKLGRLLVSIGEIGFQNKRQLYKVSFVRGIIAGLGTVIGATIVVALLLYLLSILGTIPFIGDIADSARETINTGNF